MSKIVYNSNGCGVKLDADHINYLVTHGHVNFIDQYGLEFDSIDARTSPILIECVDAINSNRADSIQQVIDVANGIFAKAIPFRNDVYALISELTSILNSIDQRVYDCVANEIRIGAYNGKDSRQINYGDIGNLMLCDTATERDIFKAVVAMSREKAKRRDYDRKASIFWKHSFYKAIPNLRSVMSRLDVALHNYLDYHVELTMYLATNKMKSKTGDFDWVDRTSFDRVRFASDGSLCRANLWWSEMRKPEYLTDLSKADFMPVNHIMTAEYDRSRYEAHVSRGWSSERVELTPILSKPVIEELAKADDRAELHIWLKECHLHESPFYTDASVNHLIDQHDIDGLWVYLRKIGLSLTKKSNSNLIVQDNVNELD